MDKELTNSEASPTTLRTVTETEKILRCSRTFLWQLRKSGDIQAIKAGKKVLIPQSSIDAFLNQNKEEVYVG
jgi:excisionase family DNA binding protein